MFSIFSKKTFIVDYLHGLTDMHCHVLPGIDDGAKDEATSLQMLKEYTSIGYIGTIATPHIMEDYYDNTSSKINESLIDFKAFKNANGFNDFSVKPAAEYMLDTGFNELLVQNDLLTIHAKNILVEFSYFQKPIQAEHILFDLQTKNYNPILAHPERYNYLKDVAEILEFKKRGCTLQLNVLSLSGHYGNSAQKKAFDLLEQNQYSYLGTDAHKPAHFGVLKNIKISQKLIVAIERLVDITKSQLIS